MTHLRTWLQLLRVPQWSKNAVVFAALVFGSPGVEHPLLRTIVAFMVFCLISSAGYIVNDCLDVPQDRVHPVKKTRPIASGVITERVALSVATVLVVCGLSLSFAMNTNLLLVMLGYLALTLAYSAKLKNIVLLDTFVIALGFLLRAVAGAAVVEVPVSPWLMLCTLLLALLLAFGKRRSELERLQERAVAHRPSLAGYSAPLLDQLMVITAGCTIMAYSFYSFASESVPESGVMMVSVPFVMFAIFRYLLLVIRRGEGGSPELLIWRDRPLLAAVVSWGAVVLGIMLVVD